MANIISESSQSKALNDAQKSPEPRIAITKGKGSSDDEKKSQSSKDGHLACTWRILRNIQRYVWDDPGTFGFVLLCRNFACQFP
jgi:hypothetical protein